MKCNFICQRNYLNGNERGSQLWVSWVVETSHSGPEWTQSATKLIPHRRRINKFLREVHLRFSDPWNSMRTISNPYDVIKMLFSDWTRQISIVTHRHIHFTLISGTYRGFQDMRNTIRVFSNVYDVIKIPISDWLERISL